jgi:class 3 adenylate cyclase
VSTERKLAAILSADVVGYSRLMAEEEAARAAAREAAQLYPSFSVSPHPLYSG